MTDSSTANTAHTTPPAARPAVVPCAACGRMNRVDLTRLDSHPVCGTCREPLVLNAPLVLTDSTFDQVIGSATVPVIVDFYADWCGPCKSMAPVFAELARKQAGRALVVKVDTDASPKVAGRFAIRSIPTITVHRGGKEVARQVGAVPLQALEQLLQR